MVRIYIYMDCGYGSTLLILFEYRMDGRRLTLVCFGQRFMPPNRMKRQADLWATTIGQTRSPGVCGESSAQIWLAICWRRRDALCEPLIYEMALTFLIA